MIENDISVTNAEEVASLDYYMPEAFIKGSLFGLSFGSQKLFRVIIALYEHSYKDILPVGIAVELIPELKDKEILALVVSELRKGMLFHPVERELNFRLFDNVELAENEIHFQLSKESRNKIDLFIVENIASVTINC